MHPDANNTPANPAGQGQGDPAPNPAANPPGDPAQTPPGDPTPPEDVAGLKKALEAERANAQASAREAKAKAKEANEALAKLKEKEDAEKSETEKLAARAEAAEKAAAVATQQARDITVRFHVSTAARDLNFTNPDDAYHFLNLADIKFDDAGEPEGVKELVQAIATERPYLIKPAQQTQAQPPPASQRSTRDGSSLTAEQLAQRRNSFAGHTRNQF